MWLQCYTEVWSVSKPGPWMPSLLTDTHWRCTFDPINWISRPFWGLCSNIRFSFLYWNVSKVKITHLFVIHVFHKTTDTIRSLHLNCAKSLDGNWKSGIASEKWQLLAELIERQLAEQFDQLSTLWADDEVNISIWWASGLLETGQVFLHVLDPTQKATGAPFGANEYPQQWRKLKTK